METKGIFKQALYTAQRKLQVTFELEGQPSGLEELEGQPSGLEELEGKELTIIAKPFRKKRSLDANAYYWQLVSKLAELMELSKSHMHNIMLRKYGQALSFEDVDGAERIAYAGIPDTEKASRQTDEDELIHLKPTSEVEDGLRTYMILRGSHTYDTREMSTLINGLVSDAKEAGIETLPPEELERMMEVYEKNQKHHRR